MVDSPVIIVGKAYKPISAPTKQVLSSMLVGHYIEKAGYELHYYDEVCNEIPQHILDKPQCICWHITLTSIRRPN